MLIIFTSSTDIQSANPMETTAQIRLGIGSPSVSSIEVVLLACKKLILVEPYFVCKCKQNKEVRVSIFFEI